MKAIRFLLTGLISFIVADCSAPEKIVLDEPDAVLRMKIADSLESAFAINKAADQYSFVAKHYPFSSFHKKAVWKAAHLYCSPLSTQSDDSASLEWFKFYASLPVSREEKDNANLYIALLNRIIALQKEIENEASFSKKQSEEIISQVNQTHELENQVLQIKEELQKLRDIDVKIHKRGTKSK
jgi:hypothetical protein